MSSLKIFLLTPEIDSGRLSCCWWCCSAQLTSLLTFFHDICLTTFFVLFLGFTPAGCILIFTTLKKTQKKLINVNKFTDIAK